MIQVWKCDYCSRTSVNYDKIKNRSTHSILSNIHSSFNIILELMYINFDMQEGIIVIDTRLRIIMENSIHPKRVKMIEIDNFINIGFILILL